MCRLCFCPNKQRYVESFVFGSCYLLRQNTACEFSAGAVPFFKLQNDTEKTVKR